MSLSNTGETGVPQDVLAETIAAPRGVLEGGAQETLPSGTTVDDEVDGAEVEEGLARGEVVGRYVILSRLGSGGMGVVYAAYDPELDRKVALKLLHSMGSAGGRAAQTRLLREAQALAKLSHPNVVGVHDVGTLGQRVWLAMEYVEGTTLGEWTRAQPRRWSEILEVALAAGRGLAAAHAAGLVHRDVKPENVMVGGDGRVRVMDFGLALAVDPEAEGTGGGSGDGSAEDGGGGARRVETGALVVLSHRVTQVGSLVGTPAYMAPEGFRTAKTDARSDIFGFCATLWDALYGEPPFAGSTFAELYDNLMAGHVRPVPRGSRVPRWLRRACGRGLAVEAEDRYPTMDALIDRLERGWAWARWRKLAALGIAVAVAAVAALAWWAWQRSEVESSCVAAGAEIEGVWNEAAKERLRRGMIDTGAPTAADIYVRTLPWVERWAAAWSTTVEGVCREAQIEGSWSPELYRRAQSCLEERRQTLEGLLEALQAAPADAVPFAVTLAAELPRIDACTTRALLERRPAPPTEALRGREAELRRELLAIMGLNDSGRHVEAMPRAEALLENAEELGYPPLTIAARVQVGGLASVLGDVERGEAELIRVFVDAGAMGMDDVAADAANRLIFSVGYRAGRHAEGLLWSQVAEMLVGRLGQREGLLGATVKSSVANVHYARGDYDESERLFAEALAISEGLLGAEHPNVADILTNLADVHYAKGDLDGAQAIYERSVAIAEASLGPVHPNLAFTLNNLATVHLKRGELVPAQESLERSLAIFEVTLGDAHPELANIVNNVANIDRARGDFERALAGYSRSVAIIEGVHGRDHLALATPLENLGLTHRLAGQDDRARAFLERSLEIREARLGAEHRDLVLALVRLGELDLRSGELEAARRGFERAQAICEGADAEGAGRVLALVAPGQIALREGAAAEALQPLQRARSLGDAPQGAPAERAAARFALAEALWSVGGEAARGRSIELAEAARATYRESPAQGRALREVEAWLRDRGR